MPYEAYIGYLKDEDHETKPEIVSGEPLVLEVRDLDTFERLVVRAIVAESPNALDDGDELWVLDWIESKLEKPWSIQVLEELDEDAAETARSDVNEEDRQAQGKESMKYGNKRRAGSQLPDMMGQEEARKFYQNVAKKRQK
ncbi:MAG TPA: hypothetical protein QF499_11000 [Gammaproteobacteria bacterium]|jgi:hypothetical protein|nr:hypothetical protein [Chromatiales bacterium]MCP4927240.1 hypothetical protein [Gammaproteobacteria bacterium]HJP39636.1 hypothetical protein [Gammaproteobacteria bacterium]